MSFVRLKFNFDPKAKILDFKGTLEDLARNISKKINRKIIYRVNSQTHDLYDITQIRRPFKDKVAPCLLSVENYSGRTGEDVYVKCYAREIEEDTLNALKVFSARNRVRGLNLERHYSTNDFLKEETRFSY